MGRKKTVDILRFSAEDEIPQDFLMSVSRKKFQRILRCTGTIFLKLSLCFPGVRHTF